MKKIDGRRNYVIVLDTETCNGIALENGVDLTQSLVYDLGWQVVDTKGNVYERRSFSPYEIFCEEKEMMQTAYYADKIPQYWTEIENGEREIKTFNNIRKQLLADIADYGVTEVYAHNASFDHRALNNTERWLTKSKYRFFFPKEITICDTLKMSADTFGKMPTYRKWCEENGYMTKHKVPRPRLTAEILYRFISQNNDFVEEHKGLADVEIESIIMVECLKKHKPMRKALFTDRA